jgi:beta-lactamase class D
MKRIFPVMLLMISIAFAGYASAGPDVAKSAVLSSPKVIERSDLGEIFRKFNVEGSFLLYDTRNDTFTAVNYARTLKRFTPASTTKIPNALIFLEAGIIEDVDRPVLKWDGTRYDFPGWNEDQTLRSAMKSSVMWFYQACARQAGRQKMQEYYDLFDYGNRDLTGGVDTFWVDGGLAISQMEQIEFLKKFYYYQLPVKKENIDRVKEIIELEKTDKYRLSGKTGLALRVSARIGWIVGYVETKNNVYFYATNIEHETPADSFGPARKAITLAILKELHII